MTQKTLISSLVGNFSLEFQVKNNLFGYFFRDTHDWVNLYDVSLKYNPASLSIQTKQFMNLRMALECVFKAILIALSKRNESAKKAYESARKCSHHRECLVKECKIRSGTNYRICTKPMMKRLIKIDSLGIGIRYDVDMKTAYKKQTFEEIISGKGSVSSVVVNDEFHKQVRKDIVNLVGLSWRIYNKRLVKHSGASGSNMSKVEDYIRKEIIR